MFVIGGLATRGAGVRGAALVARGAGVRAVGSDTRASLAAVTTKMVAPLAAAEAKAKEAAALAHMEAPADMAQVPARARPRIAVYTPWF
jgi:hypothetical protein